MRCPFQASDCEQLIVDAVTVVERYFPEYPDTYQKLGWTMFQSIDRVYDARKLERRLGFVCKTGFRQELDRLKIQLRG